MTRPLCLALSLLLLSLSCCCNNRICDCFDEGEYTVLLHFDSDSLNQGFREAELHGAYAVRYDSADFTPRWIRPTGGPVCTPMIQAFASSMSN